MTQCLFLRNLDLTVVNLLDDGGRMLAVDGAANRVASSKHLLHGSRKLVGIGALTQNLRHLDHLIQSDVATVLDYISFPKPTATVLVLLSVSGGLVQLTDDQRRGAGNNLHGRLTIHDSQLDGDLQTLPIHGSLLDIITNLLRGLKG